MNKLARYGLLAVVLGGFVAQPLAYSSSIQRDEERLEGTYVWRRIHATQGSAVTLKLQRRGEAILYYQPTKYSTQPIECRGDWHWRNNRLEVTVNRGGIRDFLAFRQRDFRELTATNWDRDFWGDQAPKFNREDGGGGGSPGDVWAGDYEGFYECRRGGQIFELDIRSRGRCRLVVDEQRGRDRVFEGDWSREAGNRIRCRLRDGNDRTEFVFERTRGGIQAVRWDDRRWGRESFRFIRR